MSKIDEDSAQAKPMTNLDRFALGAGESLTEVSDAKQIAPPCQHTFAFRVRFFGRAAASRSPLSKTKSGSTVLHRCQCIASLQETKSTNCLIYRNARFICDSSYFSHIFTILVNSFVGYEMSSLTGPVAPAWRIRKSAQIHSKDLGYGLTSTFLGLDGKADEERCRVHGRRALFVGNFFLLAIGDTLRDLTTRNSPSFIFRQTVVDILEAFNERMSKLQRVHELQSHDKLPNLRLNRAGPETCNQPRERDTMAGDIPLVLDIEIGR